jgi:hypothetical protein
MKTVSLLSSVMVALAIAALPSQAATYSGTGNVNGGGAVDGAGISSVVVNNDASSITFTINSSQAQASYIFYSIELQIVGQAGSGDTSLLNPWGEHVGISTGENALINTWGTGATPGTYGGGVWTMGAGASYAAGGTGFTYATMTVPLSSLNLSLGQSFYFDVVSSYASPGGQAAYGALDNTSWPAESDGSYQPWLGSNYYNSATDAGGTTFGTAATLYTVVPEPVGCALLGLGSLLVFIRRRAFSTR